MATPGFEMLFQNLQSIGFFEFGLPILFFIAVYYGLLHKTQAIGEDEAVQGTAAVALSFLTTLGIYTVIPFSFFPQFFAALAVVAVVLLGVVLLMGMIGVELPAGEAEIDDTAQKLAVVGIVGLLVLVFPALMNAVNFDFTISEAHTNFILTLATIAIIGYIIRGFSNE